MKILQALINVLPTRIKTAEECQQILSAKHEAVKIFGISFPPRYRIEKDVFDSATQGKPCVTIPENLHLTLIGELKQHFRIIKEAHASFKNILPRPKFQDIYEGV